MYSQCEHAIQLTNGYINIQPPLRTQDHFWLSCNLKTRAFSSCVVCKDALRGPGLSSSVIALILLDLLLVLELGHCGLSTSFTALLGPREVRNRDEEEATCHSLATCLVHRSIHEYLFVGSRRPARALYHAAKAARIPNAPPARLSSCCAAIAALS